MTLPLWLEYILNWLSLPVVALVAGIIAWRRLYRVFPLFFAFLIVTELAGILRFIVAQFGSQHAYRNVYWISDLAWMICNFLAVYELFVVRLFPKFHRVRLFRQLFPLAATAIIVGAWITGFASPHKGAWFAIQSRVLSFVLVAMLAFFVSLMMLLGRQWTKYGLGIAFGFAINNAAVLITSAAWVRSRYHSTAIDQLPLFAFDLSCLVWLYCFWSRDESFEQADGASIDPGMVHEARAWEGMLKTMLTPGRSKRNASQL